MELGEFWCQDRIWVVWVPKSGKGWCFGRIFGSRVCKIAPKPAWMSSYLGQKKRDDIPSKEHKRPSKQKQHQFFTTLSSLWWWFFLQQETSSINRLLCRAADKKGTFTTPTPSLVNSHFLFDVNWNWDEKMSNKNTLHKKEHQELPPP